MERDRYTPPEAKKQKIIKPQENPAPTKPIRPDIAIETVVRRTPCHKPGVRDGRK